MTAPRILIGGVPFGCDNVGDEAILECIVGILRHDCPGARLTVSTNDGPATARKLGVETLELFGFSPPYSRTRMAEALRSHDAFVWGGATGLSDYPEIPLGMLRLAREAGRTTVLWGVDPGPAIARIGAPATLVMENTAAALAPSTLAWTW